MTKRRGSRRLVSRERARSSWGARWWRRIIEWEKNRLGQSAVVGLALFALGAWGIVALLGGLPGRAFLLRVCGWGAYPLALGLIGGGVFLLLGERARQLWRWEVLVGVELAWLGALTLTQLVGGDEALAAGPQELHGGGLVGWVLASLFDRAFGGPGAWVLALAMTLAGGWLVWYFLPEIAAERVREVWSVVWSVAAPRIRIEGLPGAPAEEEEAEDEAEEPVSRVKTRGARRKVGKRRSARPRPVKSRSRPDSLPPMDLLAPDEGASTGDVAARDRANLIERTLSSFGVPVRVVEVNVGPAVTQFGVEPLYIERGGRRRKVRVSRIQALANDLALALAAPAVRIEAPVPGRPYVGIEVPNSNTALVNLRGIMESPEFQRLRSPLAIALGRGVSGAPAVADLTHMPHLLIAGATGSGKSVCVNSIVTCLLMNNGPDRLRFLMVDPKMVELVGYNGIPHLLAPVVTDLEQVVGALVWLTLQMDERYRKFNALGVRNLEAYNRKVARRKGDEGPLPYIVVVIDELADLMMTAPEEVERHICRLAQMARATGIHLVIATQRPSVDVVTGLIKANFPARIAFAVTSQIDSRVILDQPGAEKLLGRGDMLFMAPESSKLQRIQGCFVSDNEIRAVVDFWRERNPEEPVVADSLLPWASLLDEMEARDDLLEQALREIEGRERVSASMLQRRLHIGYPRAARLIEQLEEMGVVGPDEGGGRSRRVLLSSSNGDGDDEEEDEALFD
ncbi:MAG: DNA translocase FtsK [Chloroflexi bacterium]|nr:DNA translocase FtsK [Chloroflexota bacterium]